MINDELCIPFAFTSRDHASASAGGSAAHVALAALAIAMGCPPGRVDEVWRYLGPQELPASPGAAVDQVAGALRKMGLLASFDPNSHIAHVVP